MRVLMMVSSPFITDPRVYNEARSLIKAGYEVTVLAWDREKNALEHEVLDGIEVFRLRIPIPFKWGIGRAPMHLFYQLIWQWEVYRKMRSLHRNEPFHFIHCHFLDTLPVGTLLKRRLGSFLIYDARDIYGYMLQASLPAGIAKTFFWFERFLLRHVDEVVTVSEVTGRYFEGATRKPVTVIMNCKDLLVSEYQPSHNSKLTLLYVGTLHRVRSLTLLLNVLSVLPNVEGIIGGIGQPEYIANLRDEISGMPNVRFVGRVPFDQVLSATLSSDVVFCMLAPNDVNNRMGMPNKLFEAMACGRPLICTRGIYSGDFVESERIGLAVDYSEDALREAITKLRDDPELRERLGRNALKAAMTKYNWQREEKKLLELYAALGSKLESC